MTIAKAYGRVAEHRGDSARIEVLTFKRGGDFVVNRKDIQQQFPPHGFVFAPKWIDRFDYPIGTLIEFHISNRTSNKDDGDLYLVDIDRECKRVGYPIFFIDESIMVNELAFNQMALKDFINVEASHFYISHKGFLFGPFKTHNQEVLPRVGMTVNKYQLTEQSFECEGVSYLLNEPTGIVGKVDCMTIAQLTNFLKEQIRKFDLNMDSAELKRALENNNFDDLDVARIDRIVYSLDKLQVGSDVLRKLAKESTSLLDLYNKALQNIKDEIRSELLQPIIDQKELLIKEISRLSEKVEELKDEQALTFQNLKSARTEFDYINREKTRLIEDIRVQSLVKLPIVEAQSLQTFEEKVYQNEYNEFDNLSEFAQIMQQSIQTTETEKCRLAYHIVYQLEAHKCFLTYNIEPVLLLARLTNNCKVVTQQVEPDWLKFEKLYHNGLKQIWASANRNKSMFHFFILQDINLASFECYGRPLLDLLCELREELPGQQTSWPDNLWIFAMPLSRALGKEFGLPLLKATFKDWGFLPIVEPFAVSSKFSTNKVLEISQINNHGVFVPSFINEYFPED